MSMSDIFDEHKVVCEPSVAHLYGDELPPVSFMKAPICCFEHSILTVQMFQLLMFRDLVEGLLVNATDVSYCVTQPHQ